MKAIVIRTSETAGADEYMEFYLILHAITKRKSKGALENHIKRLYDNRKIGKAFICEFTTSHLKVTAKETKETLILTPLN